MSHSNTCDETPALHSTFAAISEPIDPFPPWPGRCLIWETARPYFYLRTTADNRVIIGGGDVPYATDHRRDGMIRRKDQISSAASATCFRRRL